MSKRRSKKPRFMKGGRWRRMYMSRNLTRYVCVAERGTIEWVRKGAHKGYYVVEIVEPEPVETATLLAGRAISYDWAPMYAREERVGPFNEFQDAEACVEVRRIAR